LNFAISADDRGVRSVMFARLKARARNRRNQRGRPRALAALALGVFRWSRSRSVAARLVLAVPTCRSATSHLSRKSANYLLEFGSPTPASFYMGFRHAAGRRGVRGRRTLSRKKMIAVVLGAWRGPRSFASRPGVARRRRAGVPGRASPLSLSYRRHRDPAVRAVAAGVALDQRRRYRRARGRR